MINFLWYIQIWDQCDPSKTGHVTRDGFYRSLALCALAQQGKVVDEKSLVMYGEAGTLRMYVCMYVRTYMLADVS